MRKPRLLIVLVLVAATGYAQTPDGDTPANEGVCDELIGFTPGLYGLCVAFCEAQDCEATYNPATGELMFDPGCRPSNPRLLANYNKRKTPDDPAMPCVNVLENECPCWTEDELDAVGDGGTRFCRFVLPGTHNRWVLQGWDLLTNKIDQALTQERGGPCSSTSPSPCCFYFERTPTLVIRALTLSLEELHTCNESIAAECADRGF